MNKRIMKSSVKFVMGFLFFGSVIVSAQTVGEPAWSTSKDVQKVSNKQLFEDESLKNSHITAAVISTTWNQSKGVQGIGKSSDIGKGNVASNGIQMWTISKGVQQIQQKKAASQSTPIKQEEQITRNGEQ